MSIEASPLRERVIFVEGAPRSGTTLLVSMLASHPEIAGTVAESHLFDRGVGALFDNHERQAQYEAYLANYISAGRLTELVRDLCDGVLGEMRAQVKPEAGRVIEKTPAPRFGARELTERKLAVYPDATYVHVVRKREGVVGSLLRAPWTDVDEEEAGEWWQQAVDGIRDACRDGDATYVEVDYEDLAAAPVETVTGLFGELDLDVDDEVRARLEAASRERISTFGPSPRPGSGKRALVGSEVVGGRGEGPPSAAPSLRSRAKEVARRLVPAKTLPETAQQLVVAARRGDAEEVAALTHPDFAFELRSGGGDLTASGDAAREALLAVSARVFRAQAVSEKWSGFAQGETSVLLLAAAYGDGKRSDVALVSAAREGVVDRLAVIAAGDPSGRAPTEWAPEPLSSGAEPAGPRA